MELFNEEQKTTPSDMIDEHDLSIPLTASETANLWASWMESSIKERQMQYFLATVKDPDVVPVLEYTLAIAKKHLKRIEAIYERENHAIPQGLMKPMSESMLHPSSPITLSYRSSKTWLKYGWTDMAQPYKRQYEAMFAGFLPIA